MKKLTLLLVSMLLYIATPAQMTGYDTNLNKTRKEIRELDRENIKLDLTIYLDNQLKGSNGFIITINCLTQKFTSQLVGSNNFLLYLHYDSEYLISFTHRGYNTKKIYVNTNCPYDNWYLITQIKLQGKSNSIDMAGKIFYSDSLQNFKALVYK